MKALLKGIIIAIGIVIALVFFWPAAIGTAILSYFDWSYDGEKIVTYIAALLTIVWINVFFFAIVIIVLQRSF